MINQAQSARKLKRELELAARLDPGLRKLTAALGCPAPRARPPGFETLLRIIVSQQLSTGVAAAIWRRLEKSCRGRITHRKIRNRSDAQLRGYGLSGQKADYARNLARMVAEREVDFDALAGLEAEAAIAKLVTVRGIGRWSAEIYAMFALGHADIFPAGDLALQVAVGRYASLPERPGAKQTAALAERWSPHRSSVALLMWKYYGAATLD
ncbi:MAG: DNA-3-methyladenine glycosylase 2 family protein [Gammaproteobacteria bacterium]